MRIILQKGSPLEKKKQSEWVKGSTSEDGDVIGEKQGTLESEVSC